MWWTYFDRFAETAQERLDADEDPVLAAADAYSYLHLVMIAGIIVFAVGMRAAVLSVGHPLTEPARLALCGGVAIYLLGHGAVRLRLLGELGAEKGAAARRHVGAVRARRRPARLGRGRPRGRYRRGPVRV